MGVTPNYQFITTPATESTKRFLDWRVELTGDNEDSTLMRIDGILGEVSKDIKNKVDKSPPAENGNLAALDSDGGLIDSGKGIGTAGGVAELDNDGAVPAEQMPGYTRSSGGDEMGIACVGGPLKLDKIRGNTVLGGLPTYDAPMSMESVESPLCLNVAGKNLIDLSRAAAQTSFGVTSMIDSAAGTITLSGTCSRPGNSAFLMLNKENPIWLPAGAYFLSGLQSDYESTSLRLYINCYQNSDLEQNIGIYGTTTMAGTAFTLSSGAWIVLVIRVPDGMDTTGIVLYPQIEVGTEKTAFEPYQGEVVEVPLLGTDGQELEPLRMAWGGSSSSAKKTYYDRIIRRDGEWAVERNVTEIDLTDATWEKSTYYMTPYKSGNIIRTGVPSNYPYCTHFAAREAAGQSGGAWIGNGLAIGLDVCPNGADTTISEMATLCADQAEAGTPVLVCTPMSPPAYEELHQDVQVLLNTLAVPGGVCSVWFEGDVLPSGADIGFPRGDYPSATAVSACRLVGLHMSSQDNPHNVTAEQVGALPLTGGVITGPFAIRSDNEDDPAAVALQTRYGLGYTEIMIAADFPTIIEDGGLMISGSDPSALDLPMLMLHPAFHGYAMNCGGGKINNLGTPTSPTDAATKEYVDSLSNQDSPGVAADQVLFADGESLQHKQENGTLSPGGIRLGTAAISMPLNPANEAYRCIAYGGGKYVALAPYFAAVSETGVDWQMVETSLTDQPNAAAYGDGRFIAVCENGAIYKSEDGLTWAPIQTQNQVPLADVVFHGGKWVAVGIGAILFSSDGDHWSEVHSGANLYAVTCGNGRFLTAGDWTMLYSDDGQSWTAQDMGLETFDRCVYGNGTFVIATGNRVLYSQDGTSWYDTEGSFDSLTGLEFGGGVFVAASAASAYRSTDGIHWLAAESTSMWTDAAYGAGRYLAISGNDETVLLTSINGESWTQSVPVLVDENGNDITKIISSILGISH